jgi:hypothetical protein
VVPGVGFEFADVGDEAFGDVLPVLRRDGGEHQPAERRCDCGWSVLAFDDVLVEQGVDVVEQRVVGQDGVDELASCVGVDRRGAFLVACWVERLGAKCHA